MTNQDRIAWVKALWMPTVTVCSVAITLYVMMVSNKNQMEIFGIRIKQVEATIGVLDSINTRLGAIEGKLERLDERTKGRVTP